MPRTASPCSLSSRASPQEQDNCFWTTKAPHRDVSDLDQPLIFSAPLYDSLSPISATRTVTGFGSPQLLFSLPASCRSPKLSSCLAFGHEDVTLTRCPASPSEDGSPFSPVKDWYKHCGQCACPAWCCTRAVTSPLSSSLYVPTHCLSQFTLPLQPPLRFIFPVTSIAGLASEILLEIIFCPTV